MLPRMGTLTPSRGRGGFVPAGCPTPKGLTGVREAVAAGGVTKSGLVGKWFRCIWTWFLPKSLLGGSKDSHGTGVIIPRISSNSRVVWVGRGLPRSSSSLPGHRQGHLPLDEVAPSPLPSELPGGALALKPLLSLHSPWIMITLLQERDTPGDRAGSPRALPAP